MKTIRKSYIISRHVAIPQYGGFLSNILNHNAYGYIKREEQVTKSRTSAGTQARRQLEIFFSHQPWRRTFIKIKSVPIHKLILKIQRYGFIIKNQKTFFNHEILNYSFAF
jgi:hypothetical protein